MNLATMNIYEEKQIGIAPNWTGGIDSRTVLKLTNLDRFAQCGRHEHVEFLKYKALHLFLYLYN